MDFDVNPVSLPIAFRPMVSMRSDAHEKFHAGFAPTRPGMLDLLVVRLISGLLAVGTILGFVMFIRSSGTRHGPREVRATRPAGVITKQVWMLLGLVPLVFLLVGAAFPAWVYGTAFNFGLPGGEVVQIAAIPVWLVGGMLVASSVRALGRFMVVDIEVRSDHELVTRGPYRWIRHPTYTGFLLLDGAVALLFLNVILIASFLARFAIAEIRARREEELLSSPEGFGERYREYMSRTGRFLPAFRRQRA
jgi:protein-S-isoprenylcysteine O-methyltransferase Ste14